MTEHSQAWRLEPLTEALWEAGGRTAYQAGIDTGHATFSASAPEWANFAAVMLPRHRHAAVVEGPTGPRCLGWAAVQPSFGRGVYAGVVEVSLYVDPAAAGAGIGGGLLQALIDSTEADGIWTLESLIFPENEASLHLHRCRGFRDVGTRERLGFMTHGPSAGTWRDVALLERRSGLAGR